MGKYPKVPRKLFLLFFYKFRKWYLFTRSLFEMEEISWVGIPARNTLGNFCPVAASTRTQSTQADPTV